MRVASLPLVSSAYDMVSTAYASTKESHPYVKSVCDAAEKGVKTLTAAAVSGAQPILTKLEPQISTANEYACKGLDKLEEKLPILQQPPEKVEARTLAMLRGLLRQLHAACTRLAAAARIFPSSVQETAGHIRHGVEGVQASLSHARSFHDLSGLVLAQSRETVTRAQLSIDELLEFETIVCHFCLSSQVEQLKQGMDQKLQGGQEKLQQMWLEWSKKQPGGGKDMVPPEPVESGALALLQGLTQQLQSSCQPLVSSLQGLPASIQDKAGQVRHNVEELRAALTSATSLQDVTGSVLAQARARVAKARQLMDELVEHVAHNTPLTWLVGPFAPSGQHLVDLETK
ncbi:perilipin-3-like [Athene cunicularia]|uniref:perilipin-3-like n=1 Tax=Athene cunicularia TaxID=194338 RepID=UPI000EF7056F|nr:perilipin-3-like [Athene cunicularia]